MLQRRGEGKEEMGEHEKRKREKERGRMQAWMEGWMLACMHACTYCAQYERWRAMGWDGLGWV
jgi:hypothetical protein